MRQSGLLQQIPPSTITAVDTNLKPSYNVQFNFILEKQIGNNVLSVGYVGTRGHTLVEALLASIAPFQAERPRLRPIRFGRRRRV